MLALPPTFAPTVIHTEGLVVYDIGKETVTALSVPSGIKAV